MSNYLLSDSRKIIYEFGTNVFEMHNGCLNLNLLLTLILSQNE